MKNGKVPITEENYKRIVLKRAIILCWVLLAICFVIKLFGGNFFAIMCESEKFIAFCEWVENSILEYIIQYAFFIGSMTMLIISITRLSTKKIIIYVGIMTLYWFMKVYVIEKISYINLVVYNIIDFIVPFAIWYVFSKKILSSLITIMLLCVFSIISSITKNVNISFGLDNSFLIGIIFMIDYYIMIVLTMLYKISIRRKLNG